MKFISGGLGKISGGRIPQWNRWLPTGAARIKAGLTAEAGSERKVVYFPSCINRSMGISKGSGERQLTEKMTELLHKGGFQVIWPEEMDALCCGMAFSSKGYAEIGKKKSEELEARLLKASAYGKYPVLCDMSPCLYTMKENFTSGLRLYEPVEFILDHLLPHLILTPMEETITVFPVCSMKKMGLESRLTELAGKCATRVIVPEANCCGFAGDRGFSFPELNAHGLRELKPQLPEKVYGGYSTSRTCEIGLSLQSGIDFRSIVYLVDQVSESKTEEGC